jgi:hypothetical protein
MVEKFTVSFGHLEVRERLIDPEVRTVGVHCPTFIVYLEIKEEKMGRKQKITLDSDSKKAASYTNAYGNHQFVSPTGMSAAYNYSSPPPQHPRTNHRPHFHSPAAAPSSSMNHGSSVHNHFQQQNMPTGTSYPYSAAANHVNHHPPAPFSSASPPSQQQPGHHQHQPQSNPISIPNIPVIDPALIAVYLQHLNLSAATAASAQQQHPHDTLHTTSSMHAVPAAVSSGASSVASAAEVYTAGHDGRSTGKFKRGEEHHDVISTRVDMMQTSQRAHTHGKNIHAVFTNIKFKNT